MEARTAVPTRIGRQLNEIQSGSPCGVSSNYLSIHPSTISQISSAAPIYARRPHRGFLIHWESILPPRAFHFSSRPDCVAAATFPTPPPATLTTETSFTMLRSRPATQALRNLSQTRSFTSKTRAATAAVVNSQSKSPASKRNQTTSAATYVALFGLHLRSFPLRRCRRWWANFYAPTTQHARNQERRKAAMPIPSLCTSLWRLIYADMDELLSAEKLAISLALLSRPPTRTEAMSNPWSTPKVLRWTNRTAPMLPLLRILVCACVAGWTSTDLGGFLIGSSERLVAKFSTR